MGIKHRDWAWAQTTISTGTKFVLVALGDRTNDKTGETIVGVQELARMTGQTDRTVGTHLAALEGLALISRRRRHRQDGSRTSDTITLNAGIVPADLSENSSGGEDVDLSENSSARPAASHTRNSCKTYPKKKSTLPEKFSGHITDSLTGSLTEECSPREDSLPVELGGARSVRNGGSAFLAILPTPASTVAKRHVDRFAERYDGDLPETKRALDIFVDVFGPDVIRRALAVERQGQGDGSGYSAICEAAANHLFGAGQLPCSCGPPAEIGGLGERRHMRRDPQPRKDAR
jgi:hypothetical protein